VQRQGRPAEFDEIALSQHGEELWPIVSEQLNQLIVRDVSSGDEEELLGLTTKKKAIHKVTVLSDHNT
jgi:hypothetical protein